MALMKLNQMFILTAVHWNDWGQLLSETV